MPKKTAHTHTYTNTKGARQRKRESGNSAGGGGVQKMEDTLPQQNQNARNCTEIWKDLSPQCTTHQIAGQMLFFFFLVDISSAAPLQWSDRDEDGIY